MRVRTLIKNAREEDTKINYSEEDIFKDEKMEFLRRTPSLANMSMVSGNFGQEQDTFWSRVKAVMTNKSFVSLCITLSGLYFVVTGIQYWASDYLKIEFGPDGISDDTVALYFAFTSFTAPISGAIAGGVTTSKMGGYNNIAAQKL